MDSSTVRPPSDAADPPRPDAGRFTLLGDYWLLIRPRIIGMVLFTMVVAALIAGPAMPQWGVLAHALFGAALVMAGAITLNQRIERHTDALMLRTARRPLPSGRMTTRQAAWFGVVASLIGLVYLAVTTPPAVAGLTLASWVIYVWMYTPMKLFSAWQTPLGAVAGAMPTLMGAAAAGAPWSPVSLALFGIVYWWQFPHAMAIAWLYRHEFAMADLKVATVLDPSGRTAGVLSVAGALVLLPISLVPSLAASAGWGYAIAATVSGLGYLAYSAAFLKLRNDVTARTLLRVSLVYLPAVFAAILAAVLSGRS